MQQKILCTQVNQMDMVEYLQKLGFHPTKIVHNDYWFLSPLRDEKTASFKVNRIKNVWYDHAIGKGGTLVDFGKLYYRCTVKELLSKLENEKGITVSFHPQKNTIAGERKELSNQPGKIVIISSSEITDSTLRNYLHSRHIPLAIANQFCHQVAFVLYGNQHLAIGFKNDNGGYEFRNYYFKGSSTPKEPRLIVQKEAEDLVVFEGFFSFLSFQTLQQLKNNKVIELPIIQADSLVLNSIAFFEKSRALMEKYKQVHLFLDNDKMGKQCARNALQWSDKYKDLSHLYKNHKDLNESLINSFALELKQSRGLGLTR